MSNGMGRGVAVAVVVLAALAAGSGCEDGPAQDGATGGRPAPAAARPADKSDEPALTPGHIVGRVTDAAGKPLADAEVRVFGTTFAGGREASFTATTDAAGAYKVRLPDGNYRARAYRDLTYNNRSYHMELAAIPPVRAERESTGGIRQDFVFRIAGPVEGAKSTDKKRYWGGTVQVQAAEGYFFHLHNGESQPPLPRGTAVEVKLQPHGPLMDGSEGKPITRSLTLEKESGFALANIEDVPVGRYTVTATVTEPGAAAVAAKVSAHGGNDSSIKPTAPAATATLDFYPMDFSPSVSGVWPSSVFILR